MSQFNLEKLAAIIKERSTVSSSASYTKSLLDSGMDRIAKKFGEESVETIIAAMSGNRDAIVSESADVFYHLLVLLQAADIPLDRVLAELDRRTAQTGLEEKAARAKNADEPNKQSTKDG